MKLKKSRNTMIMRNPINQKPPDVFSNFYSIIICIINESLKYNKNCI